MLPITRNLESYPEIVYTRIPNYRELTVDEIDTSRQTIGILVSGRSNDAKMIRPFTLLTSGSLSISHLARIHQVLVEKLLRSCPQIEAIFVLIREKKGTNGQDRLNAILAEKLFDSLHQSNPECFTKVSFVDNLSFLRLPSRWPPIQSSGFACTFGRWGGCRRHGNDGMSFDIADCRCSR